MAAPALARFWSSNENDGRAYVHPFRTGEDGKPLSSPSVTTVLKEAPKDLSQYAANNTLRWAIENKDLFLNRLPDDLQRMGQYRWKDVTNERAEIGTGIHETIEAEHRGTWNFPVLGPEQRQIMDQWERFKEKYEVTPLRSEFTVWNFTHDYAGTTDGLWWITDRKTGERRLYLSDIKTSKKIWETHWMQLGALINGEVIMEEVDDRWVEVAPNDLHDWSHVVPAVIHLRADHNELVTVSPSRLRLEYDRFLNYRSLWGLRRQIKDTEYLEANGAF